jgi:archaellum component FlaC
MDNETADDIKRHIDVVAEGLRSEIHAVDEKTGRGFDAIDQRFDGVDQRFDAVDQRFDGVDRRFDAVDQRFDAVDRRFEGVDQRRDAVDRTFEAVDHRLDKADQRFDAVDQRFDELKRHFDVVGESLRGDIRLVAEGLVGADERSAREFARVREEIGEVKTLLRVSYGELDRRERKPS